MKTVGRFMFCFFGVNLNGILVPVPARLKPCFSQFKLLSHSRELFSEVKWQSLTVAEAIGSISKTLKEARVSEETINAGYILLKSLGLRPSLSELNFHRSTSLSTFREFDENLLIEMCCRRMKREPLQYIIGDWDFHAINLKLRAPILIPRPETEELVEHVLQELQNSQGSPWILDIGCGSGAIGLAILAKVPEAVCVAIDKHAEAVKLALENAQHLSLQDRFIAKCCSIEDYQGAQTFDLIVSNPPYIPRKDMNDLQDEVINYEDYDALCGGDDGTDIIKNILLKSPQLLKKTGLRQVWMEVDTSHPQLISTSWITKLDVLSLPKNVQTFNDFNGKARFLKFSFAD